MDIHVMNSRFSYLYICIIIIAIHLNWCLASDVRSAIPSTSSTPTTAAPRVENISETLAEFKKVAAEIPDLTITSYPKASREELLLAKGTLKNEPVLIKCSAKKHYIINEIKMLTVSISSMLYYGVHPINYYYLLF
jgi:hypothetical protein